MSLKISAIVLQVVAGIVIAMGLCGVIGGIVSPYVVSCFGVMIPAALVAMGVMAVGVYYWIRAVKLKERIVSGAGL